jgi:hypothetical protein
MNTPLPFHYVVVVVVVVVILCIECLRIPLKPLFSLNANVESLLGFVPKESPKYQIDNVSHLSILHLLY